jgi:hypothetical protein
VEIKKMHNPPRETVLGNLSDNLRKAGWSWGCDFKYESRGPNNLVADAHRDDGKRFVVHADEKLTAFLELESVIRRATARACKERL